MAISSYVSEAIMLCSNHIPNLKVRSKSISKLSLISIPTSPQWFYSLTQAVTSQAENSDLLKRVLIE